MWFEGFIYGLSFEDEIPQDISALLSLYVERPPATRPYRRSIVRQVYPADEICVKDIGMSLGLNILFLDWISLNHSQIIVLRCSSPPFVFCSIVCYIQPWVDISKVYSIYQNIPRSLGNIKSMNRHITSGNLHSGLYVSFIVKHVFICHYYLVAYNIKMASNVVEAPNRQQTIPCTDDTGLSLFTELLQYILNFNNLFFQKMCLKCQNNRN